MSVWVEKSSLRTVVFRMWPRGRALEALNLSFRTLMILGLTSCKVKV